MSNLPLLQKNSYISLVISDNGIWAHLAYTDYNAGREYILSDYTDLNPLKQRLDDEFFTKNFWYEYFDNLEKVFNWNIVDRRGFASFSFRKFQDEGDGITGIRILMDENQPFFNKIFGSLREFSNDIALRIIDEKYITDLVEGLAQRLEYTDLLFVKMDLLDFKIFRTYQNLETKERTTVKSKITWSNEYGLVDSVKNSKLKAFLSTEIPSKEVLNTWSNFILNRVFFSDDPNILDILRAYSTIQSHSIYQDSKEKFENFGLNGKSGVILFGQIPTILRKTKTLLSLIDGLELSGNFDTYFDLEERLLSYGKSYVAGPLATDIILTRKDLISVGTKTIIPEIKNTRNSAKVVFSGFTSSVKGEKQEIFVLSPEFTFKELPLHTEKLIVEGEFKNGAYIRNSENKNSINFMSVPGKQKYDSLLIDARPKPVVYGPDVYSNRLKLQQWFK